MTGIYLTTMCNIEDSTDYDNPGIREKINQQYHIFEKNGIDMYFQYCSQNSKFYRYYNRMPLYRDKYDLDETIVKKSDFIYIRKPSAINMGFIDMLKRIQELNPKIRVILEIPTYPYLDEIQGFVRLTLRWKDQYAVRKLAEYVDIVVTYSYDSEIYGIKTINLSNGVDTCRICETLEKYSHPDDGLIRFIACANFSPWHGYDRVIEGLNLYLKKKDAIQNIEIEMVGEGSALKLYKRLVNEYHLEKYFKFYGKKIGDELAKIYSSCDIGFDSMGRHRSGIFYNSSLKGKEYCAYGLIVVSGVETELDHADDFNYYMRVPADDTPVDFESIIRQYLLMVNKGKALVKNDIMNYAKLHFSIDEVFKPVISYVTQ